MSAGLCSTGTEPYATRSRRCHVARVCGSMPPSLQMIGGSARFRDVLPRVRSGELPFMNIDEVHRKALDGLLEQHGVSNLEESEKLELTHAWHRIKPWPDSRSGLAQLRSRFTVSGLSVLSLSLLVSTSKAADLHWDGPRLLRVSGALQAGSRVLSKGR